MSVSHFFTAYPLAASMLSAGVLTLAGDLLAQRALERKSGSEHDWPRTVRLAIYGLCLSGPLTCGWYALLERHVHLSMSRLGTILVRMLLDQFVCTPVMLAAFLAYNGVLEHRIPRILTLSYAGQLLASNALPFSGDWADTSRHVRAKFEYSYWPVLKMNWRVWPAVQFVNFSLVPLQYRLLFVNIVALGWNAYLSLKTSQPRGGGAGSLFAKATPSPFAKIVFSPSTTEMTTMT